MSATRTLLFLLLGLGHPVVSAEAPEWIVQKTGNLATARAAHQATLLPSGHVLISGGCSGACDHPLASSERYDPEQKQFHPAASLRVARSGHVAVALPDGRVLIAGGWSGADVTATAELYAPTQDRFELTVPLSVARASLTATLLPDGRVLLAGGQNSMLEPVATVEIFDPATNRFETVSPLQQARMNHVAVSLSDGRVLLIGGRKSRRGETMASAEIFDSRLGHSQFTGSMQTTRHKHAAARLPDGRVVVLGGSDARDERGRYQSSEIYHPETGRFAPGPAMHESRFKIMHALVSLVDGSLLIAGGADQIERLLPSSTQFETLAGKLDYAPELATATRLANGEVLLVGGYDAQIRTQHHAWHIGPKH